LAIFFNDYFKPIKPVSEDHILTGSGASAIVGNLCKSIADKGDGVLLAAPYYVGFDFDLAAMNGVLPIAVPVTPKQYFTMDEIVSLERHYEQTTKAGIKIKAVILCNPHNPMGQCYPPEVIIAYAKFCEKHNLHFISDEIYALSVFPTEQKPNPEPFVSVLSIDWSKHSVNTARIHVVYGMSKDFNSNSFRIGVLVSQDNRNILMCVLSSLLFSTVSAPAGILWTNLLNNKEFLKEFVSENQRELRIAYEHALQWIKYHKLPYLPSNAGHFLLVDFRDVLKDMDKYGKIVPVTPEMTMFQREEVLVGVLIKHKVFIGSGATFHMSEGGWLRLTFSLERKVINLALRRIEDMLQWPHWPV
jgi:1-aminocyclopropane-1-carboxylate synthase